MRRSTLFVASFSPLKAAFAGALVLVTMMACSDNMSPANGLQDGMRVIEMVVPDSLKQALSAQYSADSSAQASANLLSANRSLSSSVLASPASPAALATCGGDAGTGYTESRVAFAPEPLPSNVLSLEEDKGIANVPVGFSFSFYGNSYNKLNVYSNGFITFGIPDSAADGFYRGGPIYNPLKPNNLIAFAWMDWSPQVVPSGVRYGTSGTAPNRHFILTYTDIPEYHSTGRLTSQLVLSEGSNDITIYTTKFTMSSSANKWTQGIENATGTDAKYDTIQVVSTGAWVRRVQTFFAGISLTNDAIRFSLVSTKKLSISAADITQDNDPGLGSAVVGVGTPVVNDNCSAVSFSSVRSDGAAIDAPYPVGITIITWTATDATGNSASATQTVTVLDKEAPVFVELHTFGPSKTSDLRVNATSPSGAVVTYSVNVTDNVKVTSLECEPASGSMFPVGPNPVKCTASDAAGNTSDKSFSVVVVGAQEQIASLMDMINNQLSLTNGTANPLINQLKSAAGEQGNACQKMTVFLNLLSKKGSNIGTQDADAMLQSATDIMGALGCDPATIPAASATSSRVQQAMR